MVRCYEEMAVDLNVDDMSEAKEVTSFPQLTPHMMQELFCRMDTKGCNKISRHDLTGTTVYCLTPAHAVDPLRACRAAQ